MIRLPRGQKWKIFALLGALLMFPGCGDPIVAGGGAGGGAAGPDGGTDGGLRAFVTSSKYPGDLKTAAHAASSGFSGADELCARHAADAGLKGQWAAFLGSNVTPPASRISGSGPWVKPLPDGGTQVASFNLAEAWVASIDADEKGLPASSDIWSGRGGPACSDWRSESGNGSVGSASAASRSGWQNLGSRTCNLKLSLLCLEQ